MKEFKLEIFGFTLIHIRPNVALQLYGLYNQYTARGGFTVPGNVNIGKIIGFIHTHPEPPTKVDSYDYFSNEDMMVVSNFFLFPKLKYCFLAPYENNKIHHYPEKYKD